MKAGVFVILSYHDNGMGKTQLYKAAEKRRINFHSKVQVLNYWTLFTFCICPA